MLVNNSTQKEEKCLGREGEERVDVMGKKGRKLTQQGEKGAKKAKRELTR